MDDRQSVEVQSKEETQMAGRSGPYKYVLFSIERVLIVREELVIQPPTKEEFYAPLAHMWAFK